MKFLLIHFSLSVEVIHVDTPPDLMSIRPAPNGLGGGRNPFSPDRFVVTYRRAQSEVAGTDGWRESSNATLPTTIQIATDEFGVPAAIGAAGVPGGSVPLLALVLVRVGVPANMLGLIIGVDRIIDMTRTVPNV